MGSRILITGAGGFIGQELTVALLSDPSVSSIVLMDVVEPSIPRHNSRIEVRSIKADLTKKETCESLFTKDVDVIYIFHGIMSGAAEANLDLGLKVNVDSTRQILDILRQVNPGVKIIFTSSTAVYGPPDENNRIFTERTAPMPGGSYGAQKLICELLLNDYSRRGLLDGRIVRLPTVGSSHDVLDSDTVYFETELIQVVVRPGAPTGAASSFCSGIFREPLKGEKSTLPVSKKVEVWICSPKTVAKNLIHARDIPKAHFGQSRIVNLPGITVTVQDMLDALKKVGGQKALDLIEDQRDEAVEMIVESWPVSFDTSRAKELGFAGDGTLEQTLQDYVKAHSIGR